jgi:hypothetical protein
MEESFENMAVLNVSQVPAERLRKAGLTFALDFHMLYCM